MNEENSGGDWKEWSKHVLIELKRLGTYQTDLGKTVSDNIEVIKITLERNTMSLEEHMRRTNLLEDQVRPIEKHVQMFNGVLKFCGALAVILGAIEAVVLIFGHK
jgi:hypothetical protein